MLVGFCPDDDLIAREAWERQMEEQAAQEQRVRDAKAQSAEAYAEIERGDIRAIQRDDPRAADDHTSSERIGMNARDVLYHYCCADHSAAAIDADGWLRPARVPWATYDRYLMAAGEPTSGLGTAPTVLWLTDLALPKIHLLGLTSHRLDCDRTEVRYTVARVDGMMPWLDFAARHYANPAWLDMLATAGDPAHWWVSVQSVQPITRTDLRARRATA
jgi:hypothetical protein